MYWYDVTHGWLNGYFRKSLTDIIKTFGIDMKPDICISFRSVIVLAKFHEYLETQD